jgi:hypothetical protein
MVAISVIQAVCAALLVVITYLLVCVGRTQAEWMGKQAEWMGKTNVIYAAQTELSRQQTIMAHRPRIRVREVHLVSELAVNRHIEVSLALVNSGETQGTIIHSNFTVRLWDQTSTPHRQLAHGIFSPEPYDGEVHYFESQMRDGSVLEAGIMTTPIRRQSRLPIRPDEWTEFCQNSITVYALGYIFYQNQAGQHHRTGFCYRYDQFKERFYRTVPPDPDLDYEY